MANNYRFSSDMVPVDYPTRVAIAAEWLPIVGAVGFSLYASYACLLVLGIEVGGRKVADHVGIGHTTLRRYNRLLELCGLIRIELSGYGANKIVLKEPPRVTPSSLSDLSAAIMGDELLNGTAAKYLRESVEERIVNYCSLYDRLDPATLAQISRPTPSPTPTTSTTSTTSTNGNASRRPAAAVVYDRVSERIATALDIGGANLGLCAKCDPVTLLGYALDAWGQQRLTNRAGYVVNRVKEDAPVNPDLLTLAACLLRMTREEYEVLRTAAGVSSWKGWELDVDFYPELGEEALNVFARLNDDHGAELAAAIGQVG